ncbi:MAG: ABC transporter ATP-binding protein, partial [Anaerolineae bacterium]|nr:ABC transporter ATP-binding protein [Anaerolineae bacterium]
MALQDLNLRLDDGEPSTLGIVGESGSGKTTMAWLLLGLERPTEGHVLYRGQDLRRLSGGEWRAFRRDVQAVFQDPFAVYNSFYRIDHALTTPIACFGLARSRAQRRALIEEALHAVGLIPEETLGRFPHQLSGGQRQRIMVARALLLKPKLIIADEPVSMIDASLRATVLENLRQLGERFGVSLVYVTHDLATAYQVCDDLLVFYLGSVVEAGDADLLIRQPRHPYTQLLIGSIPLPDPDRPWQAEMPPSPLGRRAAGQGCKFAPRCPHTLPVCLEAAPPLFHTDPHRAAAC